MTKSWIELDAWKMTGDGRVLAESRMGSDSPWFDGHFPSRPILPGVALLGLVEEAIRRASSEKGGNLFIESLRHVKFKKIVVPDQSLVLSISPRGAESAGDHAFEVRTGSDLVCQGKMRTASAPSDAGESLDFSRAEPESASVIDLDIDEFNPHRGGMKLLEKVWELDTQAVVASAAVNETWPLHRAGYVSSIVLIELMAQSAGILVGWKARQEKKKEVRGLIAGIRKAEFFTHRIPVDTLLVIRAQTTGTLDFYAVFKGRIETGGRSLAEIELQAVREEYDSGASFD